MNMPGFTAEVSLYKSMRAYVAAPNHAAVRGDTLVPAVANTIRYCKNTRPGWLVENTLCGECADFVLKRVCSGIKCLWQWERVSDWQIECWEASEVTQ